ncbi:histidine ammonia-lyase-like [Eriocheir sinensis]|uniref:histidine ammonia-lyase-like n=1 Tax=Eriocheir sinensis TaxID=95602 RepID=UPI0021CA34F1|nr:histidine ammonia-lyase-like [Eriocheir sinensis]XP_050696686.1 histidine ammonia-lyase-like [Eriocheir sinensis]
MKVSVRVRGEWLQVPCKTGNETVAWLGEESLRRYIKLKPSTHVPNRTENVARVRKTRGGAILDPSDSVSDVLDDNDFVSVVLESDRPNPVTEKAEIKYVTEQLPGKYTPPEEYLTLDGATLTPEDLLSLGKGRYKIRLSQEAEDAIKASRNLVDFIIKEKKVVYGITTGFGNFARTVIPDDQLEELQVNVIRSHAAGVGQPLSAEKTRMLLALRVNILAKGCSGISPETLHQYIDAFNASCLPWVPEKGTVGASGDLAPLAHLALGMLGEGKMWSPKTGWGNASYVLEAHNLRPIKLRAKEGIALINGTQLITSITAEALERAEMLAKQADVVAALTLEVLKGTSRAFDSDVHKLRHHKGQNEVASRIRALLHNDTYRSEIAESHRFCDRVQDAYTLRCTPQVHGIVHDTIRFVRGIITDEMNSATDNPLVLSERGEIISAGNFHGEYPAKAADYLAIGIHEIASMSERRIERLVNPSLSELPAFLVKQGGLNSGFMIPHCTAASLVSENKVLTHPASVDSLTTSAGTEDHVSMGGFAARKALMVVENVEHVIAIELLAACQAIEFLRPLKTTTPLEEVFKVVRSVVGPLDKDRFMAPDIDAATELLRENKVWLAVQHHIQHYHSVQDVETRVFSPTMSFLGPGPRPIKRRADIINGSGTKSPKSPAVTKRQRTSSRTSN